MSKVKIQGNASGTGVLTVTAPNTSTDRTITLPDSTGTLIADNGSGKVGVGTASPQNVLHIASGDSSNDNYRTGADTPLIVEGTTSSYIQFVADNNAPMGILMGNSSDSALGGVTYDDNNGQLRIKTNGSTRARFTNDGLCFNDDTASANALDDYEEGTWTPMLTDTSNNATMHALSTGSYTKIGRVVTVTGNVRTSSLGSVSGNLYISGLPYSCAAGNGFHAAGAIANGENFSITDGHSIAIYMSANSSDLRIDIYDTTQGITPMQGSEWSSDGQMAISVTYFAA